MASRKHATKAGTKKVKTLALKKEKLADLSPRGEQAAMVRGQTVIFGQGGRNHNETLVRVARSR